MLAMNDEEDPEDNKEEDGGCSPVHPPTPLTPMVMNITAYIFVYISDNFLRINW